MLHIPQTLPVAALTSGARARVLSLTHRAGGVGFFADTTDAPGGPWPAACDPELLAQPLGAPATADAGFTGIGRSRLLRLTAGRNDGYILRDAATDLSHWSAAIAWNSHADPAASLLAVRGERRQNYAYLSQGPDGQLTLQEDKGTARVAIAPDAPGPRLTMMTCARGCLTLSEPGSGVVVVSGADLPQSPGDLLIGCRSHRGGMPKTLGAAIIGAVLFWPGLDLLADTPDPVARDLRAALDDLILWEM